MNAQRITCDLRMHENKAVNLEDVTYLESSSLFFMNRRVCALVVHRIGLRTAMKDDQMTHLIHLHCWARLSRREVIDKANMREMG